MKAELFAKTRFRRMMRWSPDERKLRIGRLIWTRGEGPGKGRGYSAMLSVGFVLRPWAILAFHGVGGPGDPPTRTDWRIAVLGFFIHHKKSYGGWLT